MDLETEHPELLVAATTAGARVADAERDLRLARIDYHQAIRRLHLAGATVRQVAEALGISHQRVQQIVEAGGGSWWSRAWRRRNDRATFCSFCGRTRADVSKLIAGPRVYICDACVTTCERVLAGRASAVSIGGAQLEYVSRQSRSKCSFCGKKRGQLGLNLAAARDLEFVARGQYRVCSKCIEMCREILITA